VNRIYSIASVVVSLGAFGACGAAAGDPPGGDSAVAVEVDGADSKDPEVVPAEVDASESDAREPDTREVDTLAPDTADTREPDVAVDAVEVDVGPTCDPTTCIGTVCAPASCIEGVCTPTNVDTPIICDDGNACTLDDHCDGAGACAGTARVCDAPPRVDLTTACAGATTVDVFLGEGCGGACEPTTGECVYTATTLACPDDQTKLAHTRGWQLALRDGLSRLTEADFEVPFVPMTFDAAWYDDPEVVFRMWVASYGLPSSAGLRQPAPLFLLNHIEQADGVRGGASQADINGMVFWYRWDYPGNPHHGEPAAARRAFVMAAVDLIMIDTQQDPGMLRAQQHFLSGTMNWMSAAYLSGHEQVDACTAAAYRLGLQTMFERLEEWDTNNGNNDMAQPGHLALYEAAAAMPDKSWLARAESESREMFTDAADGGYWHEAAGYFDHGVTLDTSYEGITTHMLSAAALAIPWPHLSDAIAKYARLKSHMVLPEPDGASFTSPTHWNPATAGGVTDDQWWSYGREVATAMLSDEALYLLVGGRSYNLAYNPLDLTAMRELIMARLPGIDATLMTALDTYAPALWVPLHWSTGRAAAVLNYRYGFYAHLTQLAAEGSPLLKPPVMRGENYIENFGDDFVIANLGTYAAIIYTGPIADEWAVGMAGMGGGALSAFWTPTGGSFLLGLTHGSQNPHPDTWDELRSWPTEHLYGVTPEGGAFSTAMVQHPGRTVATASDSASIDIDGAIGPEAWSTADVLTTKATYTRHLALDPTGVHVTTMLSAEGATVCELVDVVPLYRKDSYQTDPLAVPVTTFITKSGARVPASSDWTLAVAVEVQRFTGKAIVTLDRERRVRMAAAEWTNAYQTYTQASVLHIDALGGDACTTLPASVAVGWTIAPLP